MFAQEDEATEENARVELGVTTPATLGYSSSGIISNMGDLNDDAYIPETAATTDQEPKLRRSQRVRKPIPVSTPESPPVRQRSSKSKKTSAYGLSDETSKKVSRSGNYTLDYYSNSFFNSNRHNRHQRNQRSLNDARLDLEDSEDEGMLMIDDPESTLSSSESESESDESESELGDDDMTTNDQNGRVDGDDGDESKATSSSSSGSGPLVKRYVPAEMDEKGKPKMPIVLGNLTVWNLGTIVTDRPKYHSKRYIWPVGFKSSRVYTSMFDVSRRCMYTSEILDGGPEPRFMVTSSEDEEHPIIATTASGAWAEVGKRVGELKDAISGRKTNTQLSGPEMFGFSHPTINKILQDSPKCALLDQYEFQVFISSTPKNVGGGNSLNRNKKPKSRRRPAGQGLRNRNRSKSSSTGASLALSNNQESRQHQKRKGDDNDGATDDSSSGDEEEEEDEQDEREEEIVEASNGHLGSNNASNGLKTASIIGCEEEFEEEEEEEDLGSGSV